nr:hypothetical protein BaRGS_025982 [Batillaria attramentaria]
MDRIPRFLSNIPALTRPENYGICGIVTAGSGVMVQWLFIFRPWVRMSLQRLKIPTPPVPHHVCDGMPQCPQRDDELACDVVCPQYCECHGLAFFCMKPFPAEAFPQLRFLDAHDSGMGFADVTNNMMMVHLSLAKCGLTYLHSVSLPNLISLNLSDNLITTLTADQMNLLPNLKVLTLAGNPLTSFFSGDSILNLSLPALQDLDVSRVFLPELDATIFVVFPELQVLNLSDCGVERLLGDGASHWEFYSHTGICIPLPIARNSFPGHTYSFSVFIVLNFVLFVAIAAGQVFVFWSIRSNSMSGSSTASKTKDLTIARRLITVAVSDFLCWFPICLLGLLAQSGTPIPGEVNVAMAIIALPLNSALNPFLYTVNMILERRRNNREEHLQKLFPSGTLQS